MSRLRGLVLNLSASFSVFLPFGVLCFPVVMNRKSLMADGGRSVKQKEEQQIQCGDQGKKSPFWDEVFGS